MVNLFNVYWKQPVQWKGRGRAVLAEDRVTGDGGEEWVLAVQVDDRRVTGSQRQIIGGLVGRGTLATGAGRGRGGDGPAVSRQAKREQGAEEGESAGEPAHWAVPESCLLGG